LTGRPAARRKQRVSAWKQLAAKAAADIRRNQANFFFRYAKRLGHVSHIPGNHLVRGPERELVAVPGSH
jgi:hypothetical protein